MTDLARRVWEHKLKAVPGFTAKYGIDQLVWFEAHETLEGALIRERQIKEWKRDWKINLIERETPHWVDLCASFVFTTDDRETAKCFGGVLETEL
jgi:putative endonuclease